MQIENNGHRASETSITTAMVSNILTVSLAAIAGSQPGRRYYIERVQFVNGSLASSDLNVVTDTTTIHQVLGITAANNTQAFDPPLACFEGKAVTVTLGDSVATGALWVQYYTGP